MVGDRQPYLCALIVLDPDALPALEVASGVSGLTSVAKAAKDWWSKGLLTPAHLRARAYRWTGKLFLAHLFEVGYWYAHGRRAPRPYVIEHLGHAHPIEAPHAPWRTE